MANNIKLYFSLKNGKNELVKSKIFNHLRFESSPSNLINILNIIENDKENIIYNEINIKNFNNNIKNFNYEDYEISAEKILRNGDESIKPENSLEAIVMGALYFKIDISNCNDPLYEYSLLSKFPYFPHDNNIKEKLKETFNHPDSLDNPYLNKNFNLNFPENMYSNRDLIYLCGQEGIFIYDETHYSALQLSYMTETFIHGKQGNITNELNIFLENIYSLDYDEVLVYGIRNGINS